MNDAKTVYDKFHDNGLFTAYLNVGGELPFETTLTSTQLDILYNTKCGMRELSTTGKTLSVEEIARYLKELYSGLWSDKYAMYLKTKELANGDVITHTETVVDDNNVDNTSTTTKQVSAFNDEDTEITTDSDEDIDYYVDNDKSDVVNNIKTDNERQKDYTETALRLKDREKVADLLQTEFLCDTIFVDINHFITISVF